MLKQHVVPLAVVLALALLCAQVSTRLRAETLTFMFEADLAVLRGKAIIPEFQNRVLSPLMLWTMRAILPEGMTDKSVWQLMRVLQASISFGAVYVVAFKLGGDRQRAVFTVGLIAFAYLWTPMTSSHEITNDFFDIMFTALLFYFSWLERAWALLGVVMVSSANRESGIFAAMIWGAIAVSRYGLSIQAWKKFLPAAAALIVGALAVVALRYGLAPDIKFRQFAGGWHSLALWRVGLTMTGGLPMILATALLFAVALSRVVRPWSSDQRGLLLAAAVCFAITLVFGIWFEIRIFLPSWTLLALIFALGPIREREERR